MKKIDSSKYVLATAVAGCFFIMLLCNFMVHLFSDDYVFAFNYASFYTESLTRIDGLASILTSLKFIYFYENGRLVAHFFAQLFIFLPSLLFKLLNSIVFALEIYLMYRIANRNFSRSTFLFCILFGCIWIFQPAFGEVNLWLDGACNYLWCAAFNLIVLTHYWKKFLYNRDIQPLWRKILFVIFSLFAGGYGENASLATLIMALAFLAFAAKLRHFKVKQYQFLAILAFFCGFVFMMSSPAELSKKFSTLDLFTFCTNLSRTLNVYYKMRYLLVAFVVFFTIAVFRKLDSEVLIGSGILFVGSLCSQMALSFAEYCPERSAFYSCILLILACGVLFRTLLESGYCEILTCLGVVVLLFTLYYGVIGIQDMYTTHYFLAGNEQTIAQALEDGITDLALPLPPGFTKYSQIYSFPYLNLKGGEDIYPNCYMAEYYGLSSLVGK